MHIYLLACFSLMQSKALCLGNDTTHSGLVVSTLTIRTIPPRPPKACPEVNLIHRIIPQLRLSSQVILDRVKLS